MLNNTTLLELESSCKQPLKFVTVNEQVAVLLAASVAVQVTVVVPSGNDEPLGGTQAVVTPGQLSLAVGGGKLTTPLVGGGHVWAPVVPVIAAGQVIEGGCVSLTVTVNEQELEVSEQVTVVVPTGKNELEGGAHVIVLHEPTLIGAG